jgi:hypothetical protein
MCEWTNLLDRNSHDAPPIALGSAHHNVILSHPVVGTLPAQKSGSLTWLLARGMGICCALHNFLVRITP